MLNLHPTLTNALNNIGITTPTAAQSTVIPQIIEGNNIIALWKTGSGKTLAYLAPIINNILNNSNTHQLNTLILSPTRELANQISSVCNSLSEFTSINSIAIYGGESYESQIEKLKSKPQILVATPGRLEDLISQGHITINNLNFFVLDEVDQMLTLGFREPIIRIAKLRTKTTQSLSFSATATDVSMPLIQSIITNATIIKEEDKQLVAKNISHRGYFVEKNMMERLLVHVVKNQAPKKTIVFTRSKKMADTLTNLITQNNLSAEAIHSDKSQKSREHILHRFTSGENSILVATDIIARGIDIPDIQTIINFGLPLETEQYIHRIGRAARSQNTSGESILLCPPEEKPLLDRTCSLMKQNITMSTNHPFLTIQLTKLIMGDTLKGKDTKKKKK